MNASPQSHSSTQVNTSNVYDIVLIEPMLNHLNLNAPLAFSEWLPQNNPVLIRTKGLLRGHQYVVPVPSSYQ